MKYLKNAERAAAEYSEKKMKKKDSNKTKELAKNTVIILIGKIFTQFLSFFLLPLYTYHLPASDYGAVDLFLTYITLLAPVVTIQQEMATFRFLIDSRGSEREKASIIKTSFQSCTMRLMVFAIPCIILALLLKSSYLLFAVIAGSAVAISNLLLQIARGVGDNMKYSIASVIAGAATIVSNIILICIFHFGAESVLISMALANMVSSVYLVASLKICHYYREGLVDVGLKNKMLKFSWPLVPHSISWWVINASDRTIVSTILGTAANGIYTVSLKFPSIVSSLLSITVMSWTESASLHIDDEDRDEFFSKIMSIFIKTFSSLGVLIIAALPFIFNIVIGEEYRASFEYIPVVMLGVLMSCIVGVYSAIYVAKKMTKQVASISIVSAVINIIVDLLLINFVGLYAASISTAVAFAFMAIYRHFDLKKYIKIRYRISDIVIALCGFIIVSIAYYSDNIYGYMIGAVVAMLYAFIANRNIASVAIKRVCRRNK